MQEIEVKKQNALEVVGDYITPNGMVDLKSPTDMIKQMMQRVMDNPKDKDAIAALQVVVEGGRGIVEAGKAQNDQADVLVRLLQLNKKLEMI